MKLLDGSTRNHAEDEEIPGCFVERNAWSVFSNKGHVVDTARQLTYFFQIFAFFFSFRVFVIKNYFTMAALWARYTALLEAQPLLTKALTSLTGFTAGDVLAQKFIEDADAPYDYARTLRLGSFGFLCHGPTCHYFYQVLDAKMPSTAASTVCRKLLVDKCLSTYDVPVRHHKYLTNFFPFLLKTGHDQGLH